MHVGWKRELGLSGCGKMLGHLRSDERNERSTGDERTELALEKLGHVEWLLDEWRRDRAENVLEEAEGENGKGDSPNTRMTKPRQSLSQCFGRMVVAPSANRTNAQERRNCGAGNLCNALRQIDARQSVGVRKSGRCRWN